MNVEYLIQLLGNRQVALTTAIEQAFTVGDPERITNLRAEADQVADTLVKLRLILSLGEAAVTAGVQSTEIVSMGIEAVAAAKEKAAQKTEAADVGSPTLEVGETASSTAATTTPEVVEAPVIPAVEAPLGSRFIEERVIDVQPVDQAPSSVSEVIATASVEEGGAATGTADAAPAPTDSR